MLIRNNTGLEVEIFHLAGRPRSARRAVLTAQQTRSGNGTRVYSNIVITFSANAGRGTVKCLDV